MDTTQQLLLHKNSSPMLVNSSEKETEEINKIRWNKFDSLPENIKDKLSHQDTIKIIQGVGRRYSLSIIEIAFISRMIRGYYFREIKQESFENYLSQTISKLTLKQVQDISNIINIKILQQSFTDDTDKKQIIKLSLNKAIQKYPQILKQQITDEKIITKPFLKPLIPNVKNWIMVYEKILGVSVHTMIERGNFVFRSEATKRLDEESRKKLLILFKSRDDNSELMIDVDEELIVFTIQKTAEQNISKQVILRRKIMEDTVKPAIVQNESQDIGIHPVRNISENNIESKNPQLRRLNNMDDVGVVNKAKATLVQNESQDVGIHPVRNVSENNEAGHPPSQNYSGHSKPAPVQSNEKSTSADIGESQDAGIHPVRNISTQVDDKLNSIQKPDLSPDIQKEIAKNRIEMDDKKVDKKTLKNNDSERKQSQIGTPVQKNVNNAVEGRTIIKSQEKISTDKKQGSVYGDVSFSSNHVMPAEQKKKSVAPVKYNAFNMKPLGQVHKEISEGVDIVDEVV